MDRKCGFTSCYPSSLYSANLLTCTSYQATETHILNWVKLLHLRLTICTVQLVATHCDLLLGGEQEKEDLLQTVEVEFRRLHDQWMDERREDKAETGQMVVSKGIISVACCLPSEQDNRDPGLTYIRNELFKTTANKSYIPQSWVEAKRELIKIGGGRDEARSVEERARPMFRAWAMRDEIHEKFSARVMALDSNNYMRRLSNDAIHAAMEGALELR